MPSTSNGTVDTVVTVVTTIFSAVSTVYGLSEGIAKAVAASSPVIIYGAAITAAVVTLAIIATIWYKRCLESHDQFMQCTAGVVNSVVPAFSTTADAIFPFASDHDRVDVVVKSAYWPTLTNGATWVFCSNNAESPLMIEFYHNDAVCGAGVGAVTGGAIAGVVGVIAGIAAGIAIGGCVTVILCVFAILLAVIITVAAVIVGAIIGGNIGRATSSNSGPMSSGTPAPISVGDYVTSNGNVIISGDFKQAAIYWFVTDTALHGQSTGTPEFATSDPDANLVNDGCPSQ